MKRCAERNRVVFDTNIVISGLLNPAGVPSRILQYLTLEIYELLVSEEILAEYQATLNKFGKIRNRVRKGLLKKIHEYATRVRPKEKIEVIKEDPADNKFLECAVAGKASALVSGDRDLLNLKEFRGIEIIKAADYLKALDSLVAKLR